MIPTKLANHLYWRTEKNRRLGIKSKLESLLESQYFSPQECRELQNKKLFDVLTHAYKTVPYYTRVFNERGLVPEDINSPDELKKLPLLTREVLLKNQSELTSTQLDGTEKQNFSSGSTGQRACFVQDENFRAWMRAHQIRTYQWCSEWDVGEKFALLWGSDVYWSSKQISDQINNFSSNRREFNTFKLSPALISKFADSLTKFDPVLISTYSNAMHLIAREMERRNTKLSSLRAIQGTSEPLPPAIRDRLRAIFDCKIYDKYGSRETNIVSHESPNNEGMLIQTENVAVEFIDVNGDDCKVGEKGQVILTTLNNFAMPLIRYETSDVAGALDGYCSSGLGLPRMTHVAGRQQDLIVTPNDDYIDAYFFSFLIMAFSEIEWFQVIQPEIDTLSIRVMAPNGVSKKTRDQIVERIHHHSAYKFRVEFDVLSQMPESPTGKFRLCVSELSDIGTGRD